MLTHTDHRTASPAVRPWIHGAFSDVALGWCWLPVALLMHSMESSVTRTQNLMAIVFLISFAHQPLTLGLVYGDEDQRNAHKSLYRWAPLGAVVLITIGLSVSLTLVALMAGLWNAEHTLMQRYGLMRIYGRKAGDTNGGLEKPMLVAWLITALLFIGAYVNLPNMITKLGMDETNGRSVNFLHSIGGATKALFWTGMVVSLVLAARWMRAERSRRANAASRAKWIYTLGTLGLVAAVMIDPIAGVAGYVAAHAIEYFAIVHGSLRRRSAIGDTSAIGLAASTWRRRSTLYGGYFVAVAAVIYVSLQLWDGQAYAFAILFFGALHILYDGFVWKLRKPSVAASLGIVAAPA